MALVGDVKAQTRVALQNMGEILKAAGASYKNGIIALI